MVAAGPPAAEKGYFLPNRLGRVYLQSLEEFMGRNALNMVLGQAGLRQRINNYPPNSLDLGWAFEEMSALHQALEEALGERAGRGLASRAGRASFYAVQEEVGAVLGTSDVGFRVLPLAAKLRVGLSTLADLYNKTTDQASRVTETETQFLFLVDRCPICWRRRADVPICHGQVGLFQEAVHWMTGQNLAVEEVECTAQGRPSCCYAIDKRPLR